MITITKLLIVILGSILLPTSANAKSWRGIVPLHSNCEDVKRLLGRASCKADFYRLEHENVFITFSEKHCDGIPIGWDVPVGTVLSIDVQPKIKPRLVDIIDDCEKYSQTRDQHLPDVTYYADTNEGLTLTVYSNGEVGSFFYGPTGEDIRLSCPNRIRSLRLPKEASKFDEYSNLHVDKERVRLSYFAAQLRARPKDKGYIIVHNPQGRRNEWRVTADRVKKYLIDNQRIPAGRLVVAEGSEAHTAIVELYIVPSKF